jgi:FMN-dependent NADH-azoreductase
MAQVLYIKASPRVDRSHSIAVADAFVEAYRESAPNDEIVGLDLFEMPMISFDGLVVQAKYRILHNADPTEEQKAAWAEVEALIQQFKAAGKYVMAVPMWNFSIPYRLKQYIDILVQPGYTFGVTEDGGFEGLVTGKPVFIAYARGGEYVAGTPAESLDHQRPYLEMILGFMGFTDIRSVTVEPTLMDGPETAGARRAAAIEKAGKMARDF